MKCNERALAYFARRNAQVDRATVVQFLNNRSGGEPPRPGDEMPEGHRRPET